MLERGVVRSVSGDLAEVEMIPASAEECRSCRVCGESPGVRSLAASGGRGLVPGRVVEVEVGAEPGVGPALVGFLLPVAALCLGAVAGSGLFPAAGLSASAGAVLGALLALSLSFPLVRAYDRKLRRRAPAARIVRPLD